MSSMGPMNDEGSRKPKRGSSIAPSNNTEVPRDTQRTRRWVQDLPDTSVASHWSRRDQEYEKCNSAEARSAGLDLQGRYVEGGQHQGSHHPIPAPCLDEPYEGFVYCDSVDSSFVDISTPLTASEYSLHDIEEDLNEPMDFQVFPAPGELSDDASLSSFDDVAGDLQELAPPPTKKPSPARVPPSTRKPPTTKKTPTTKKPPTTKKTPTVKKLPTTKTPPPSTAPPPTRVPPPTPDPTIKHIPKGGVSLGTPTDRARMEPHSLAFSNPAPADISDSMKRDAYFLLAFILLLDTLFHVPSLLWAPLNFLPWVYYFITSGTFWLLISAGFYISFIGDWLEARAHAEKVRKA